MDLLLKAELIFEHLSFRTFTICYPLRTLKYVRINKYLFLCGWNQSQKQTQSNHFVGVSPH